MYFYFNKIIFYFLVQKKSSNSDMNIKENNYNLCDDGINILNKQITFNVPNNDFINNPSNFKDGIDKNVIFSNDSSILDKNKYYFSPNSLNNLNNLVNPIDNDKENDPKYLKYIIFELNHALDINIEKIKILTNELNKKNIIENYQKKNIDILNNNKALHDEIKIELDFLNQNFKNLNSSKYNSKFLLSNYPKFEKNKVFLNDLYKNLNLKMEIV